MIYILKILFDIDNIKRVKRKTFIPEDEVIKAYKATSYNIFVKRTGKNESVVHKYSFDH